MREIHLRKLHRYLGLLVAPLVLLQAASGLILSVDLFGRWQGEVRRFLEGVDLPALAVFWDAVLYEIHFGSGSVGVLHNVAVGVGLLVMVLTGVLVFVMFLVRTRFKSHADVPAAPSVAEQPQPVPTEIEVVSRRRVVLALAVAALGLMALDVFIFSAAYRLIGLHVPHLYAASQVEVGIVAARAAIEGQLAGDSAGLDSLRSAVERARRAADALLTRAEGQGEREPGGREVLPVEDLALRAKVEVIAEGLGRIQELAGQDPSQRTTAPSAVLAAAAARSHRSALEDLEVSARGLTEALMDVVERDRERFFTVHLVLFSAAFLFLVAVGSVLYFYETARELNLDAVHTARDIAHAYERRFRGVTRHAAVPLLVLDDRGDIVAASLSAAYFLGYAEDELRTLNIADIDHCTPASERETLWAEIARGAPAAVKSCWRHRNGTDIPVVLSVAAVDAEDGEVTDKPLFLAQARQQEDPSS